MTHSILSWPSVKVFLRIHRGQSVLNSSKECASKRAISVQQLYTNLKCVLLIVVARSGLAKRRRYKFQHNRSNIFVLTGGGYSLLGVGDCGQEWEYHHELAVLLHLVLQHRVVPHECVGGRGHPGVPLLHTPHHGTGVPLHVVPQCFVRLHVRVFRLWLKKKIVFFF